MSHCKSKERMISIVIPCYNEEDNIPGLKTILEPELKALDLDYEVVVIDDGSTDETQARLYASDVENLRVVQHAKNGGLGAAIRTGIAHAQGDQIVLLDSDMTFHPKYIRDLKERYEQGDVEAVIGSHGLAGYADDIPKWRVGVSKAANLAYSLAAGTRVHGISSIFRIMDAEAAKRVKLETTSFDTPTELFFKMHFDGSRYVEIPTPIGNREFGSSKLNYKKEIPRHVKLLSRVFGWRLKSKKKDKLAWIVALAILALYALPHFLIPQWQAQAGIEGYHPYSLNVPVLDDVAAYGTRMREVFDGHLADGDAYLAEYKNNKTAWGNIALAFILGLPGLIFGITDPTNLFLLYSIIFPPLAFLMLYELTYRICDKRQTPAVLLALVTTIFPNILIAIRAAISNPSLFHPFKFVATAFDPAFTRSFIPSPGIILWFAFMYFLYRVVVDMKQKDITKAGLLLGALFYVYFYYAVFAAFTTILITTFLFFRKRAKETFLVGVIGLIVAIPYLLKTYGLQAQSYYASMSERVGLVFGREFDPASAKTIIATLIIIALAAWTIKQKDKVIFLAGALLPIGIVLNLQLLLGFNPQPDHWGSRVNVYMLVWVIGIVAYFIYHKIKPNRDWKKAERLTMLAVIILLLGSAFHVHLNERRTNAARYVIPQDIQNSFAWMNENVDKDSVIISPSTRTSTYTPFFTHANVYVPLACYTVAGHDEVIERYNYARHLFRVSQDMTDNTLTGSYDEFENPVRAIDLDNIYTLFCDTLRTRYGKDYTNSGSERTLPEKEAQQIRDSYDAIKLSGSVKLPYQANYIYNGPHEKFLGNFNPDEWENIERVYSEGQVDIYKII